jgi:5'-nucleotidase
MPVFHGAVVASNFDVSGDPALRDRVVPRAVVTRGGTRVGIVGALTDELNVEDHVEPYVESVQRQVDALTADGVKAIVLVSHCSTKVDVANAAKISGVDVIVAGHDHALLGDAAALRAAGLPEGAFAKHRGAYPLHATAKDGRDVPVVSAYEWGRLLGRLDVTFDGEGNVVEAHGAPIVLGASWDEGKDAELARSLDEMRGPVTAAASEVLAKGSPGFVRAPSGQSPLGALFADAMLDAARKDGAVAALAEGDARADLPAGALTYGSLFEAWPFPLTIQVVDLSGEELAHVVAHALAADPPLQLAGVTARFEPGKAGEDARLVDVRVGGEAVSAGARYKLAIDGYTAMGGDGYTWLKGAKTKATGVRVTDAVADELRRHPKTRHAPEGRAIATSQ